MARYEEDTGRLADALVLIAAQDSLHAVQRQMHRLRHFLAGALCAECGEPLGDNDAEIISDEDDRTVHQRCERTGDDAD